MGASYGRVGEKRTSAELWGGGGGGKALYSIPPVSAADAHLAQRVNTWQFSHLCRTRYVVAGFSTAAVGRKYFTDFEPNVARAANGRWEGQVIIPAPHVFKPFLVGLLSVHIVGLLNLLLPKYSERPSDEVNGNSIV